MSDGITKSATELSAAANGMVAPDGRAVSAWRHGMYARRIAVGEEEAAGFEQLRAAITEQWRPRSVTAWMLVDRLARLQWKLMRAEESEIHMVELAQTTYRSWCYGGVAERSQKVTVDRAIASDLKESDSGLAKLQLFQMRLERSIYRTISLLTSLRKSRGKPGKGRTAGAGEKSA